MVSKFSSSLLSNNTSLVSKYNAAFRISQEISNRIKYLKQDQFVNALSQLNRNIINCIANSIKSISNILYSYFV